MSFNLDELLQYYAHVYVLTNSRRTVFYVGVTQNLPRRIEEHSQGQGSLFTSKYKLKQLVYFEGFEWIQDAVHREKQLKKWHRSWKVDLISNFNPKWQDLTHEVLFWGNS